LESRRLAAASNDGESVWQLIEFEYAVCTVGILMAEELSIEHNLRSNAIAKMDRRCELKELVTQTTSDHERDHGLVGSHELPQMFELVLRLILLSGICRTAREPYPRIRRTITVHPSEIRWRSGRRSKR
jgi:hypothetical protein